MAFINNLFNRILKPIPVSAKSALVLNTTGIIYTVPKLLGSSSTFALITGSNSNLSINSSTGQITATAAIGSGSAQQAVVRETNSLLSIGYPITLSVAGATPTPTPTPGPTPTIPITGMLWAGDSIVAGAYEYNAKSAPGRFTALTGIPSKNLGVDGRKIQTIIDNFSTEVVANYTTNGYNYLLVTIGVNDILGGATAAYITGKLQEIRELARSAGIPTYFGTITKCGTGYSAGFNDAARVTVNNFIRSKVGDGSFLGIVDYDADSRLQDPTDVTVYSDQLHFTSNGYNVRALCTQIAFNLPNAAGVTTPTLSTLTLSPNTATVGVQYEGNIGGKTTASYIQILDALGLSVNGSLVYGTPTKPGVTGLKETLTGATNNPRTTTNLLTVSAAAAPTITGVIFAGDSITKGYPFYDQAVPKLFGDDTGLPYLNNGVDGAKIQRNIDTYQTEIVANYGTNGYNRVLTTIGINDVLARMTGSAANTQDYVTGKIMELHNLNVANNIPSWFGTLTACGPSYNSNFDETARLAINTFIRNKVTDGTFAGVVDYASDSRLQDPTDTSVYSDQLHFTAAGNAIRKDITKTAFGLTGAATPSTPTLSLSGALSYNEGNSGTTAFNWTLTLNRSGSTAAFPYTWSVAGTGSNPANAADFGGTFPSGSGTFAANETTKVISVLVSGDTTVESDEEFLLTASGSGLNTVTSKGTIVNDDAATPPPASGNVSFVALAGNTTALTLSNNNLTIKGSRVSGGQARAAAITTLPIVGKMLFSATLEANSTQSVNFGLIGVSTTTVSSAGTGFDANSGALFTGLGQVFVNSNSVASFTTPTVGQTVTVYVDLAAAKMWFTVDGSTWYGTATVTLAQVNAGTSGIDISVPKSNGTLYFVAGERDTSGFQWTMKTSYPLAANTRPTGATYIGE